MLVKHWIQRRGEAAYEAMLASGRARPLLSRLTRAFTVDDFRAVEASPRLKRRLVNPTALGRKARLRGLGWGDGIGRQPRDDIRLGQTLS